MESNLYLKNGIIDFIFNFYFLCKEECNVRGNMVLFGFIDVYVYFNLRVGNNVLEDDFYNGFINVVIGGIIIFIDFLDFIKEIS